MAFHASQFSTAGGIGSIVVTWCTTSPGDDVWCLVSDDDICTFTAPVSGNWAAVGAVQQLTLDNQSAQLFHFTGNSGNGAPASPPSTETWRSTSGLANHTAVMFSLSSRTIGSTSFVTQTNNASASVTPPFTATLNGGTATAGDDLIALIAIDNNAIAGTVTSSVTWGGTGSFVNRGATSGGGGFAPLGISTLDNIAAGATGTLSDAWTDTNSAPSAWMAWVFSVQSGAPFVPKGPDPYRGRFPPGHSPKGPYPVPPTLGRGILEPPSKFQVNVHDPSKFFLAQLRPPGYPRRGPKPGIPQLGVGVLVPPPAPPSNSTPIYPAGIDSASDFGAMSVYAYALPAGVDTSEVFGTSALLPSFAPSGIDTGEAFGAGVSAPTSIVSPAGIDSAEFWGASALRPSASPAGTDTGETLGASALRAQVASAGVGTDEVLGAQGTRPDVDPAGIETSAAVGASAIILSLVPAGTPTLEAFGAEVLTPITLSSAAPAGIESGEFFGASALRPGTAPAGVDNGELWGASALRAQGGLAGTPTGEAFGASTATPITLSSAGPSGIDSAEAWGALAMRPGAAPAGVAPLDGFGAAQGAAAGAISGTPSGDAWGSSLVRLIVLPAGLESLEASGVSIVRVGVAPAGAPTLEAFGLVVVAPAVPVYPYGVPTGEAFGAHVAQPVASQIRFAPTVIYTQGVSPLRETVFVSGSSEVVHTQLTQLFVFTDIGSQIVFIDTTMQAIYLP